MAHISAEDNNVRADALSRMRGRSLVDTVSECPSLSALLGPGKWVELDAAPWLALCDPKRDVDEPGREGFLQFWHELRSLLWPQ